MESANSETVIKNLFIKSNQLRATLYSCLQQISRRRKRRVLDGEFDAEPYVELSLLLILVYFFASTQNTNSKFQSDLGYGRRAALRMCYH